MYAHEKIRHCWANLICPKIHTDYMNWFLTENCFWTSSFWEKDIFLKAITFNIIEVLFLYFLGILGALESAQLVSINQSEQISYFKRLSCNLRIPSKGKKMLHIYKEVKAFLNDSHTNTQKAYSFNFTASVIGQK